MKPFPRWFLAEVLTLAILSSAARAEDLPRPKDELTSRFFSDTGLGAGGFVRTDPGPGRETENHFAIGLENKVGGRLNENFSVFFLTSVSLYSFETVSDFARWVYKKDDYLLFKAIFLTWFIPMAAFLDSQAILGPGVSFQTGPAPAFRVELGGGLASTQSAAAGYYLFGFGLYSGLGLDITDDVRCSVRLLWSPPAFHSKWTPSESHVLSLLGIISY